MRSSIIRSPHVVSITLIDLPGLVVNRADGQGDIRADIEALVKSYAQQENVFIIAVQPAQQACIF